MEKVPCPSRPRIWCNVTPTKELRMVFEWVPGPRDCLTYSRRRRASIGSLLRTKDFKNEMVIDEVSVPFYYALPFSPRALRLHGGLRRIESRYQVTPSASLLLCTFPRVSASLISISVCEFFLCVFKFTLKRNSCEAAPLGLLCSAIHLHTQSTWGTFFCTNAKDAQGSDLMTSSDYWMEFCLFHNFESGSSVYNTACKNIKVPSNKKSQLLLFVL